MPKRRFRVPHLLATMMMAAALLFAAGAPVRAATPIRIGFSMALTGPSAVVGKQVLVGLQLWRDDVNAKGGLLGRPLAFVYYDDQSNPANVPSIYTKLIDVDKVDLVIGPYATNMVAPALTVIMQHDMVDVGILALDVNTEFKYPRYFSTLPLGPQPKVAYSQGFFELAMAQTPKPKTVALVAADAEFAKNSADGARENAKKAGLTIVYDKSYPPSTTDYAPIVRAIQATNPDIVFAAAYPADTLGIVRAVNEIGFTPKMFGGTLVGLLATQPKVALGPLLDGIVMNSIALPIKAFSFPGLQSVVERYQKEAPHLGIDPLGYEFPPYAYAAGQILAAAVTGSGGLDQAKMAAWLHGHSVSTVVGDIAFAPNGEWSAPRIPFVQFQKVRANDLNQFRDNSTEIIVWPARYKTGAMIYPYAAARAK